MMALVTMPTPAMEGWAAQMGWGSRDWGTCACTNWRRYLKRRQMPRRRVSTSQSKLCSLVSAGFRGIRMPSPVCDVEGGGVAECMEEVDDA